MDGSENDGINLVLTVGVLVMLVVAGGLIGFVVWLYGRQSAKRRQAVEAGRDASKESVR